MLPASRRGGNRVHKKIRFSNKIGDVVFNDTPFCLQQSAWSRLTTCWQMVVVMFQNPLPEGHSTLPIANDGILRNV
jgi:hypothetical protein